MTEYGQIGTKQLRYEVVETKFHRFQAENNNHDHPDRMSHCSRFLPFDNNNNFYRFYKILTESIRFSWNQYDFNGCTYILLESLRL